MSSKPQDGRVYREGDTAYGHITAEVKNGLVTLTLDTNRDGTPDITMNGSYSREAITTTVNGMNVLNTGITADAILAAHHGFSERELGNLAAGLVSAKRTADIENGRS